MRILFCAPLYVSLLGEGGGIYKLMVLREQSLRELGHEVVYFSPWQKPNWADFDLCHLFAANGDTYNLGVQVKRYLPLVVSPIIDRIPPYALLRLSTWIDRLLPTMYSHLGRCAALCRLADMVCVSSREEEKQLVSGLGVKSERMVVHSPVTKPASEMKSGRLKGFADKPYVLFLGDAGNPRKNVIRLIGAVAGLDIQLLIGGFISPGSTADKVRLLAQRLPNVHIVGFLDEPEKNYAFTHAKAFVLPSLTESIGLAALEAALFGTTIVVTKNGAPPDYFEDEAYYVNPFSVADIRQKIQSAISHPRNCAERLFREFSLQVTGQRLETCYRKALGEKL